MADISVLLSYFKETFRPNPDVSFDRRFYEIRTTPLLILDGFKESNMNSNWTLPDFEFPLLRSIANGNYAQPGPGCFFEESP